VHYSLVRPNVVWRATPTGLALSGPDCPWYGNCGAEITVAVPKAEPTAASSGSGDVHATDLNGALTLHTGSGDIVLGHLVGPLVISDGSGDIHGIDLDSGAVRASDDSGNVDLTFTRPPDRVDVNDSSGDITVTVPAGVSYRVITRVGSGSTHISVATDPTSTHVIDLTDDSGDVRVVPSNS